MNSRLCGFYMCPSRQLPSGQELHDRSRFVIRREIEPALFTSWYSNIARFSLLGLFIHFPEQRRWLE